MAHPDCIRPIALPRCSGLQLSATRTLPADHSPPSPKPRSDRQRISCPIDLDVAVKAVNTE